MTNKIFSGILMMLLHAFSMSVLYIFSKNLTKTMDPLQVAFLYKFTILLAILPWCLYGGAKKNLKTKKIGMHVARGSFSSLGTVCFFVAVSGLPAINAAAITFLDQILVVLIGIFYFKEKFAPAKLVSILLSFIGAVLIMRLGFGEFYKEFLEYYLFLFLALIFWALNCTAIKVLGKTERTKVQLFYTMFFSSLFSLPFALRVWEPLEIEQIKYILGIAVCYLVHSIAFFKAFKYADMSTIMPFDYTRLVFTGILGYLILNEVPDTISILGYLFITLSGLYLIYHETIRKHIITKKNILSQEV